MASKCSPTGKSSWPELVGVDGEYALIVIPKDNPNIVFVQIVAADAPDVGTGDVNCGRVKVKVDQDGIVVEVPTIG